MVYLQVAADDPDWLVEQFRGNVIVDGVNPFEEDQWKTLEVVGMESVKFRSVPTYFSFKIIFRL